MSKELIEKLREIGKLSGWEFGKLMHEAADALEAKAAPVGEREAAIEAAYAAVVNGGWDSVKDMGIQMFQAGAAHQRQQAREVVMPGRAEVSVRYGYRSMGYAEGWNDCIDEVISLNKGAGSHE